LAGGSSSTAGSPGNMVELDIDRDGPRPVQAIRFPSHFNDQTPRNLRMILNKNLKQNSRQATIIKMPMQDLSKRSRDLSENRSFLQIQRVAKEHNPALARKNSFSEVKWSFIMRMKSNLSRANHMRVQSNKNIPLTSILKLKDTNSMRMQSEKTNLLMNLLNHILADVMHQVMASLRGERIVADSNRAIFMDLGGSATDEDFSTSLTERVTIF
jgi:hypothetical protein